MFTAPFTRDAAFQHLFHLAIDQLRERRACGLQGAYLGNTWLNTELLSGTTTNVAGGYPAVAGATGGTSYTQFVCSPSGAKIAVVQNGSLVKGTVPLPGGGSAIYHAAGFNYFRHKHWLFSSRLAATWGHNVYAREDYAPFGENYNEVGHVT